MENIELFIARKPHLLRDKSFHFAVRIVRLYKYLTEEKREFILSKQLLRSGTNPGAMVREALNAESNLDFVHKLAIAQKEIGETQYWLELLYASKHLNEAEFSSLYQDSKEIMSLTRSTILTKKKNIALKTTVIILTLVSITQLFF